MWSLKSEIFLPTPLPNDFFENFIFFYVNRLHSLFSKLATKLCDNEATRASQLILIQQVVHATG